MKPTCFVLAATLAGLPAAAGHDPSRDGCTAREPWSRVAPAARPLPIAHGDRASDVPGPRRRPLEI